MTRKSRQSNHQVEFSHGGSLSRRRTTLLADDAYRFEDEMEIEGVLAITVITCAAWLVELFELQTGELYFISGGDKIRPGTNLFGVLYPPFTITRPCFQNVRANVIGIATMESLPEALTAEPIVFDVQDIDLPSSVSEVFEIIEAGSNRQRIQLNPGASILSLKAKKLIDKSYLVYPSIARVAQRLNVTHAHLSRRFKRDLGMSPSDYLRRLRVADAPLRLARGEKIVNVSLDVGYNDLSRFYKQFRKTTDSSPGACKALLSPNTNNVVRKSSRG